MGPCDPLLGKSNQTTSRPITAFFKTLQQLSQSDQKKLLDASTEYIVRDIRSFKAVEDPGFGNMADSLVQLDAKYRHFVVNKACHPSTLLNDMLFKRLDEKQKKVIIFNQL